MRLSRMRPGFLVAVLLLALAGPARAALTEAQLAEVELAPPPGARLPPGLALRDEDGRDVTPAALQHGLPAVLVLADFTCVTLCGPALGIAAHALAETGLRRSPSPWAPGMGRPRRGR